MRSIVIVSMVIAASLSGCTRSTTNGLGASVPGSSGSSTPSGSATPSTPHATPPHTVNPTSSTPTSSKAAQVLASMSEAERVGQLLMVDNPSTSVSATTLHDLAALHVGGVILDGNSYLSIAQTRAITARLRSAASIGLLISTDQEGGIVRRLRGPGFSNMPSALVQGGMSVSSLHAQAITWGQQLKSAGVNMDLAPVLDTVPSNSSGNPPIGDLDREYGHDTATVATHGIAVATGLAAAGVAATVKHFPGLGRVSGNTDTTSGVTDSVTTALDPYLTPFADAINADVPFVMMSTAIYARIDPGRPAAFSSKIIGSILRGQLGFHGVVISDDLGAAQQVADYSIGTRAVDFIQAGGDIVLTVSASQASTMTSALLARTQSDPRFKALVDAAALTVLQEKQSLGLLR